MRETVTGAKHREDVTVDGWTYDNPAWMVVGVHPVVSTGLNNEAVEEIEIEVYYRETDEVLCCTGTDVAMALAMINSPDQRTVLVPAPIHWRSKQAWITSLTHH